MNYVKNIFSIMTIVLMSNALYSMELPPDPTLSLSKNAFTKRLKENPELINQQDNHGKTLLIKAIEEEKEQQVKTLLVLGADPFIAEKTCETAFHAAAKIGNLKIVRLLAQFKGDTPEWEKMMEDHNFRSESCNKVFVQSPISYAQKRGYRVCEFIFKNFHKYKMPLSRALVLGNLKEVEKNITFRFAVPENLQKAKASLKIILPDIKITDDCTPLCFAILLEDEKLTSFLLEKGAQETGSFLTKTMTEKIPANIIKLLEAHKIDYKPKLNKHSLANTAQCILSKAVLSNDMKEIDNALAKGATINGLDNKGNTALHWACTTGNPELIAYLIKLGANLDLADRVKGRNGLRWALRMHAKSVEKNGKQITTSELLPCFFLLISAGADTTIKDREGQNIHYWIPNQNFDEVELKLINRILKAKELTKAERKVLLEDIFIYQMKEKNKWRKDDDKFDLRNVYNVENANVKIVFPDGKSIFKDIYKEYIE
jgi:ankyrin repeat protein